MTEAALLVLCGLTAGVLGGYLGLGGGIIMVPFMTLGLGMSVTEAIPISAAAIIVTSLSGSNPYLGRGMVDKELVAILTFFMVVGSLFGSSVSGYVPKELIKVLLAVVLLWAAVSLIKNNNSENNLSCVVQRRSLALCAFLALLTGVLASLVGIGGGVILVPMIYLVIGLPLSIARGTSSMMTGFSSAAAAMIYFMDGKLNVAAVGPVILGVAMGAQVGGRLGTTARPKVVKALFFVVMVYLAFKLGYDPVRGLL